MRAVGWSSDAWFGWQCLLSGKAHRARVTHIGLVALEAGEWNKITELICSGVVLFASPTDPGRARNGVVVFASPSQLTCTITQVHYHCYYQHHY